MTENADSFNAKGPARVSIPPTAEANVAALPAPKVTVALDEVPTRLDAQSRLTVTVPGYTTNNAGDTIELFWTGGTVQVQATPDSEGRAEGVDVAIPLGQALAGPIGYTVRDTAGGRTKHSPTITVRTEQVTETSSEDQPTVGTRILVFDLGGGTFDVSVLDFSYDATTPAADNGGFLGGPDVMVELADH